MTAVAESLFGPYKADASTRVKVGVGIILRDSEGRLLLEKRGDCGLWGFCGGKVEPGESVTESAVREVREETGLEIRITRFVGVYSEPGHRIVRYPNNGEMVHLVDVILEAEITGGTLVASPESEELRFFAQNELPKEMVPPAFQPLEDYLKGLSHVLR